MKLSKLAKTMVIFISAITAVFIIAAIIYHVCLGSHNFLPFILGALMGAAAGIIKVILLEWAINKTLKSEKKGAAGYVSLQYMLRFAISAAVLLIAVFSNKHISIWGAAAGILSYQVAVYGLKFTEKGKR